MSKRLWARISVVCEVTDEEYEQLEYMMEVESNDAATMLNKLFRERGKEDGDNYLVGNYEDNPNYDDFDF